MGTLVVDNLSPFTADILACLKKLGIKNTCKRFSEVTSRDLDSCDRIVLSGRRRNDPAINAANSRIVKFCHDKDIPLLGICYGAEIIALTLGGSIRRMPLPVQGQIEIGLTTTNHEIGSSIVPDKSTISVYESHGFCVARLPSDFVCIAESKYCPYEIFVHRTKRIYGTQFHPEKSGVDGLDLFENFGKIN